MKIKTAAHIGQTLDEYREGGEERPSEMLATAARLVVQCATHRNWDEPLLGAIVRLIAYLETPVVDREEDTAP